MSRYLTIVGAISWGVGIIVGATSGGLGQMPLWFINGSVLIAAACIIDAARAGRP